MDQVEFLENRQSANQSDRSSPTSNNPGSQATRPGQLHDSGSGAAGRCRKPTPNDRFETGRRLPIGRTRSDSRFESPPTALSEWSDRIFQMFPGTRGSFYMTQASYALR